MNRLLIKLSARFWRLLTGSGAILLVKIPLSLIGQEIPQFQELWESSRVQKYSPALAEPFIGADEGIWVLGDTVSEFSDCGETPHSAEIVSENGNRFLRLTSGRTDCADNVWVAIADYGFLNPGFGITVDENTILSFDASGELDEPEPMSKWDRPGNCFGPPCYDSISLIIEYLPQGVRKLEDLGITEDDLNNMSQEELMDVLQYLQGGPQAVMIAYVLDRPSNAEPNTDHSFRTEVFLDPNARRYRRNLYQDLSSIPDFEPGGKITTIQFSIDDNGWATLDNLEIGEGELDNGEVGIPPSVDIIRTDAGEVKLEWLGEQGASYQIEWSTDLREWQANLPGSSFESAGESLVTFIDEDLTVRERYYRVRRL